MKKLQLILLFTFLLTTDYPEFAYADGIDSSNLDYYLMDNVIEAPIPKEYMPCEPHYNGGWPFRPQHPYISTTPYNLQAPTEVYEPDYWMIMLQTAVTFISAIAIHNTWNKYNVK